MSLSQQTQNAGAHLRRLRAVKWELLAVLGLNVGVWLLLAKLAAALTSKTLAW